MLFSGLFRNSLFFLLIAFGFLFFGAFNASAFELGMSPAHINMKGDAGEIICLNVSILSKDYNGSLFLSSRWLPAGEKREIFEAYTLSAEERGIGIYHNSIFPAENRIERVCVRGMKAEIYRGILMLQPLEGIAGVASKIEVKIENESADERGGRASLLSGASILGEAESNQIILIIMLQIFVLSAGILGLLIMLGRKKKEFVTK